MFVKRTEALTASMPDTVLPAEEQANANSAVAVNKGQPGLAESAGGAAVALAGWALTSLSSRLGQTDLNTPMLERNNSSSSVNGTASTAASNANGLGVGPSPLRSSSQPNLAAASGTPQHPSIENASTSARSSVSIPSLGFGDSSATGDWGGDLMDVQADQGDFDDFESAPPAPPAEPVVHPRFVVTKTKPSRPIGGAARLGGASAGMKLGGASSPSKSNGIGASRLSASTSASRLGGGGATTRGGMASVLREIEADEGLSSGAGGDWSFDGDGGDEGPEETPANGHSHSASTDSWDTPKATQSGTFSTPDTGAGSVGPGAGAAAAHAGKDKLAQMKEARLARLAAAKEKKNALGAKKL